VNDFERSLARLQPDRTGLNSDAVIFDAGFAAGRRGQRLWMTISAALAIAVIGLGAWGMTERTQRRALADVVRAPAPPIGSPSVDQSIEAPSSSPDGYLRLRRRAEQDPNGWLASWQPEEAPGPPGSEPIILRAWQRDGPIDP